MHRKLLAAFITLIILVGCRSDPTPVADVTAQATPRATEAPTALPTPSPTATATLTPSATPTPVPTSTPTPTPGLGLVAFESYRDGNAEIYVLDEPSGALTNLTRHPADDRAPAWRPDGGAIAFESNRDGNWEIYVLELATGAVTRLTDHPNYDGAPSWSPEGTRIAFESYRDGNLEIYTLSLEGDEFYRLTDDPAGDYGPAWSLAGDQIAFTSWRDGNKEIYTVDAGGGEPRNVSQHPADDEDPAWTPDGSGLAFVSWRDVDQVTGNRNADIYLLDLADGSTERVTDNSWPDLDPAWDAEQRLIWAAYEPGPEFETYDPHRPGDYHLFRTESALPAWPSGPSGGVQRLTDPDWDDRRPAPAPAAVVPLDGLADRLPSRLPTATPGPILPSGELADVVEVPGILASYAQQPVRVNELVAPSLEAWRQDVLEASGWDFLHGTLGAWRNIDSVRKREMYMYDYGFLSWHKAGRALDLALEYKVNGLNQMIITREDLGPDLYWRIYLRTARQDGSQGEPLKDNPWLFWWHIVPAEQPEAYAAGGKRLPIPAGYFVDITALAKRHGWERIAAYAIEGDYHWNTDSNGTEYWHYERTDGLTWWEAMQQLYPPETLEAYVGWEMGLQHAQSEAMMRSKGVPPPVP
jgi:TolB protein